MSRPSELFIYRLAEAKNRIDGKCIVCSQWNSGSWDRDCWRGYVLPDGPGVEVSQVLSDTSLPGCEPGFESVYDEEPFVSTADYRVQPRLLSLQNYTYVHLTTPGLLPKAPFFVSFDDVSTPVRYLVTLEIAVGDILEVPDVQFYVAHYESPFAGMDKWDRLMLANAGEIPRTPLPIGCFLPMFIRQGDNEVVGVYRLLRKISRTSAESELYLCNNSLELREGCTLLRKATNRLGQTSTCRLATILKHSEAIFG